MEHKRIRTSGSSGSPPPPFQARAAAERAAEAATLLQQNSELINLTHEAIFALDQSGKIVYWNQGAEKLYGWTDEQVLGKNALDLLMTGLPLALEQIEAVLRNEAYWEGELQQTTRDGERITVASRWALWHSAAGECLGRFQLDADISKRKKAEQELRVLSGRLLTLQDEERRRLARDLHDSVGQLLAGAAMTISSFAQKASQYDEGARTLLSDTSELLERALTEIRTISYLLHPPLLDEMGLVSALQWYIFGFSERSRMRVTLAIAEDLGRFRHELELAVFRVVQECLSNVHRHSGSATASISIARSGHQLRLTIEDQGRGMTLPISGAGEGSPVSSPGVGISGMRERVRQLGGELNIRSGSWGTTVEAVFPVDEAGKEC